MTAAPPSVAAHSWLRIYRRCRFVLVFAPAVLLSAVFFFVPVVSLLRVSVYIHTGMGTFEPGITAANYLKFISDPFYRDIIFYTLKTALLVTAIALVAGYPAAYAIARARGTRKIICLLLIIVPLWTNLIVRIYGWFIVLGRQGLVNTALVSLGVVDEPLSMVFTHFAVVIGLLDMVFPWVLLILISVMEGIDWSLIEAARDLGASRWQSFYEVTFKLSIPGVAVGGLFAFVWAMGEYAVPSLLGSSSQRTISIEVADQILTVLNWPFGASIAFTLLMISVAVLFISNRLSHKSSAYMHR